MSNITIAVENITPTKAKKYLEDNADNQRSIRMTHVEFLAGQMDSKNWSPTAEDICFADDGTLINGQHRLNAIMRLDKAVKISVKRGQPRSDFHHIDTGIAARHAEDHANIEGREHSRTLVPLFRWQRNFEIGGSPTITPGPRKRMSEYQLQSWGYEMHYPAMANAVSEIKSYGKIPRWLPIRAAHWCFYRMWLVDPEMAKYIMSYLVIGTGAHTDTMHLSRERMMEKAHELQSNGATPRVVCESIVPMISHLWWCSREGLHNRKSRLNMQSDHNKLYVFE